jgi:putative transposase
LYSVRIKTSSHSTTANDTMHTTRKDNSLIVIFDRSHFFGCLQKKCCAKKLRSGFGNMWNFGVSLYTNILLFLFFYSKKNQKGESVNPVELQKRFPNIVLHEHIIMPNHIHGIIEIVSVGATLAVAHDNKRAHHNENVVAGKIKNMGNNKNISTHDNNGQPQGIAPTITIGNIIGAFKSITTKAYICGVKTKHWESFNGNLWQRNYYEHIIRTKQSYNRISEYIIQNPIMWKDDRFAW